jgi:hypothetical protein
MAQAPVEVELQANDEVKVVKEGGRFTFVSHGTAKSGPTAVLHDKDGKMRVVAIGRVTFVSRPEVAPTPVKDAKGGKRAPRAPKVVEVEVPVGVSADERQEAEEAIEASIPAALAEAKVPTPPVVASLVKAARAPKVDELANAERIVRELKDTGTTREEIRPIGRVPVASARDRIRRPAARAGIKCSIKQEGDFMVATKVS